MRIEDFFEYERLFRQRTLNYLKEAGARLRFLKGWAFRQQRREVLMQLDLLERDVEKLREDIEHATLGSYAVTVARTMDDGQLQQALLCDELILAESRSIFEDIEEEIDVTVYDETKIIQGIKTSHGSVKRVRELLMLRSEIVSGGVAARSAFETLAEKYYDKIEWLNSMLERQTEAQMPLLLPARNSVITKFLNALRGVHTEKSIEKLILNFANTKGREMGGMCSLGELVLIVDRTMKGVKIADVEKAVKELEKRGLISGLRIYSGGIKVVELLPSSFTGDQKAVLDFASEKKGRVSMADILQKFGWNEERALKSLKELEEIGVCRYDVDGRIWSFPAFISKVDAEVV